LIEKIKYIRRFLRHKSPPERAAAFTKAGEDGSI
jgi:hypothetical protein